MVNIPSVWVIVDTTTDNPVATRSCRGWGTSGAAKSAVQTGRTIVARYMSDNKIKGFNNQTRFIAVECIPHEVAELKARIIELETEVVHYQDLILANGVTGL